MKNFRVPALCFALVFPTLLTWVYFSWLKSSPPWIQQTAYGVLKTIQFLFPIVWFLFDRTCFDRGLNAGPENTADVAERVDVDSRGRSMTLGLGFGGLVWVLIFVFYFGLLVNLPEGVTLAEKAGEKVAAFQFANVWMYVGLGLFYSLIHSFLEEYYWRWFVFQLLRARMGFVGAAWISSLGFMAHHVILLTYFFGFDSWVAYFCSFGVAVGGWVWSWLYERSNRLVVPWLSHLLVDAAIFTVGYFVIRHLFEAAPAG